MSELKRVSVSLNEIVAPKIERDAKEFGISITAMINIRLTEYYKLMENAEYVTSGTMAKQLQELKKAIEDQKEDDQQ